MAQDSITLAALKLAAFPAEDPREAALRASEPSFSAYLPIASHRGIAWQEDYYGDLTACVDGLQDFEASFPGFTVDHPEAKALLSEILDGKRGQSLAAEFRACWDRAVEEGVIQ